MHSFIHYDCSDKHKCEKTSRHRCSSLWNRSLTPPSWFSRRRRRRRRRRPHMCIKRTGITEDIADVTNVAAIGKVSAHEPAHEPHRRHPRASAPHRQPPRPTRTPHSLHIQTARMLRSAGGRLQRAPGPSLFQVSGLGIGFRV